MKLNKNLHTKIHKYLPKVPPKILQKTSHAQNPTQNTTKTLQTPPPQILQETLYKIMPRTRKSLTQNLAKILHKSLQKCPRKQCFILPITVFQSLNFNQSPNSEIGFIIIKVPKTSLHPVPEYWGSPI